jgi:hypothetical protein
MERFAPPKIRQLSTLLLFDMSHQIINIIKERAVRRVGYGVTKCVSDVDPGQ